MPHDTATAEQSLGATDRLKAILDMLARQNSAAPGAAPEADWPDGTGDRPSISADSPSPKATLGELIDALDERAYGIMLLLLALPCCLPFLYGIPQIVALPMLALTAQLAAGREAPWLPKRLSNRQFEIAGMQKTVDRASRYLGWAERLSHARLRAISDGVGARIAAALLLIPCASILVPLPMTNTTPGIGVAIAAFGFIERDGLMIILGLAIGILWVALLIGLFIFFGVEGATIFKDWIKALF